MTKQEIKISVLNIDDEEVDFRICIKNGTNSTSLDFFGYKDEFKSFAASLVSFPKSINDIAQYELGEDVKEWAYYMLLKVYCYERNGQSAINIKIDNHKEPPYLVRTEFFITTVPASLNKLGDSLLKWNPVSSSEFIWEAG